MSYTTLNSSDLAIGQPLKVDIFNTIKSNEDNLDSRTTSLEGRSTNIQVFKFMLLNGSSFTAATGISYFEADSAFTITEAFIRIFEIGSMTGIVEIDIKKSTTDLNSSSFTSIFTTKPSITLGATSYIASTNKVFNSGLISIAKGNYLRLDITQSTSTGILPKLLIDCYGA